MGFKFGAVRERGDPAVPAECRCAERGPCALPAFNVEPDRGVYPRNRTGLFTRGTGPGHLPEEPDRGSSATAGKGSRSPGAAGRCSRKNKVEVKRSVVIIIISIANSPGAAAASRVRERAARRLRGAGGGGRWGPGRAGVGGAVGSRAMPSRAEPRLGDVRLEEEPPPPALLLSGAGTWPQATAAAGRAPPSPPSAMGTPHF